MGLVSKLISWKIISVVTLLVTIVYFQQQHTRETFRDSEEQKATIIALMMGELVAANLELGLHDGVLETIKLAFNSNPAILKMKVYDEGLQPVLEYPQNIIVDEGSFRFRGEISHPYTPLPKPLGYIDVYYSSKEFQTMEERQRLVLILLAVVLSVYLVISYTIMRHWLKPILQLSDRLYHFSPEAPKIVVEKTTSQDEAGVIQNALHQLLERFLAYHERINTLNENLEDEIRKQTKELQAAKDAEEEKNRELLQLVSELKQTQGQLVEREKLASLGNLVAGVAHEINTPVGVAVTASTTLRSRAEKALRLFESGKLDSRQASDFMNTAIEGSDIIYKNLKRAADLVRSFKHMAVDQASDERKSIDLCEYLEEIKTSLIPQMKRGGHQLEIQCPSPLHMKTHPGAISQILTNFVTNSIAHGFKDKRSGLMNLEVQVDKEADIVKLIYQDNGAGMSYDVMEKMYEPFFSTNRAQGGSGLGMNIVYNLVYQTLKGKMSCQSELGQGVRFRVDIPLGK